MSKDCPPISKRISRVYYIGGIALLALYSVLFNATVSLTEDLGNERRLEIVAPYHFQLFEQGYQGSIQISPLIHIYDDIKLLPVPLQRRLPENFQGIESYYLEELPIAAEYVVYASLIETPSGSKTVYALEVTDAVEWDEVDFLAVEIAIFVLGFTALLVIAGFIVRASLKISEPFIQLANQLESKTQGDFAVIEVDEITSKEFAQTLTALNNYRNRISELLDREKSFTRYVSHELRTPMTVVKGALSILRKQDNEQALKQAKRIHQAIEQMENLTHTFLLLARNEQATDAKATINDDFIVQLSSDLSTKAEANQTELKFNLINEVELDAEPLLLYSVVHNILLNAINSTLQGQVEITFTKQAIEVLDNGVGLQEKARGYEGFGIGLLLVQDICQKYGWSFKLEGNTTGKGCKASVSFQ